MENNKSNPLIKKVIVFGGSFNPPTLAHQILLISAVEAIQADIGIFVPSNNAYVTDKMKSNKEASFVLSEEVRYRMLATMAKSYAKLAVSDLEFRQGRTRQLQTVDEFSKKYPNASIYFLLGVDKYDLIEEFEKAGFFERFFLIVFDRDNVNAFEKISASSQLQRRLNRITFLSLPKSIEKISSSDVRKKLLQGNNYQDMLPKDVCEQLDLICVSENNNNLK